MALVSFLAKRFCRDIKSSLSFFQALGNGECRSLSSSSSSITPKLQSSLADESKEEKQSEIQTSVAIPLECRFIYPEFLPDPKMEFRNNVREKLERMDMMNRRAQIDIPEFYVGSIMAVTLSKSTCTRKIKNVIDHQGVEVFYEMYNPLIQKIDVLRLEKRLDNELLYLRDALPEYSTFPLDMEPEFLPEGAPVPVNTIKVKLKPFPWLEKWERKELKGVQEYKLPEWNIKGAAKAAKPWEKYDLMLEYRASIPEEEQNEIFTEVYSQLHQLEMTRRKLKRKRTFVKPKKEG
ncbi:hypothetical protein L9F63_013595 [Diploptera punctata]|uniref:Large ribosomal subunit protein bL19m n=1 Tax=Diploptera punctata TaxID=6984 RepID=A0AAD8ELI9_DIPPU|nr:hypothetical protein L9F63_013595 [Diploptera punctata]